MVSLGLIAETATSVQNSVCQPFLLLCHWDFFFLSYFRHVSYCSDYAELLSTPFSPSTPVTGTEFAVWPELSFAFIVGPLRLLCLLACGGHCAAFDAR